MNGICVAGDGEVFLDVHRKGYPRAVDSIDT